MTVNTKSVSGRRELKFRSLDEAWKDAEHLCENTIKTLGNWTLPQIIDHLARSIRNNFEGPPLKAPWFVRYLIGPMMKNGMLNVRMPSGFQLPANMKHFLPGDNPVLPTVLNDYKVWTNRLTKDAPTNVHPVFGKLKHEEWINLHLRHVELHLSFVIPEK
ncbi:MAG: DUF1569 domain-containing protein [Planctomycetes bacterium]|nr:DUF1569 domain-containing protein [Planctomycetota bacterium]